jgi:hypothetical protein
MGVAIHRGKTSGRRRRKALFSFFTGTYKWINQAKHEVVYFSLTKKPLLGA